MHAQVCSTGCNPIGIVGEFAGRAELVGGERVINARFEAAGERGSPAVRRERTPLVRNCPVRDSRFRIALASEKLDHRIGRFGTEQRALRSTDDFDAIKSGRSEMHEVKRTAGFGEAHAIQDDGRAVAVSATRENADDCAVRSGLRETKAGDVAEHVLEKWELPRFKILQREDVGRDAGFFDGDRCASCADDHAVAMRFQSERDGVSRATELGGLGCESGFPDGSLAGLSGTEREFAAAVGGGGFRAAGDFSAVDRACGRVEHDAAHIKKK